MALLERRLVVLVDRLAVPASLPHDPPARCAPSEEVCGAASSQAAAGRNHHSRVRCEAAKLGESGALPGLCHPLVDVGALATERREEDAVVSVATLDTPMDSGDEDAEHEAGGEVGDLDGERAGPRVMLVLAFALTTADEQGD